MEESNIKNEMIIIHKKKERIETEKHLEEFRNLSIIKDDNEAKRIRSSLLCGVFINVDIIILCFFRYILKTIFSLFNNSDTKSNNYYSANDVLQALILSFPLVVKIDREKDRYVFICVLIKSYIVFL
jgi:hypothetical protein